MREVGSGGVYPDASCLPLQVLIDACALSAEDAQNGQVLGT